MDGLDEGRLFVRNLPYSSSEPELQELFGAFGRVDELLLPLDAETRRAKGFAHVTFSICEHAVRAMSELDGSTFQGEITRDYPRLLETYTRITQERARASASERERETHKRQNSER